MRDFGLIKPGSTLEIFFDSFAAATGAPSAMTGLAVGDIKIYKDGSTTERASTSGYTLLDSDGLDFDGMTGVNGIAIDLADNTTSGFWAAGSRYAVYIDAVTVDSQTVRFLAATFRIGLPAAVLNTTIASLSSQTSFTLTKGPAEDDALNGCLLYIHDVASEVQGAFARVLDYTGSTKTVTLDKAPTFTIAASDNVMVMPPDIMARRATIRGSVSNSTTPSTTQFTSAGLAPAGASTNQFIGRIILFDDDTTTAALRGQATKITASTNAANPLFTFDALSTAPTNGDTFTIV